MARVYLALGSNLTSPRENLHQARAAIAALPRTQLTHISPTYDTLPVGGPPDQARYANAVVQIDTMLSPRSLLEQLQAIESRLGREPRDQLIRWGPRLIDIDILLYDDQVIDEPGLTIPHRRFHQRWFVLRPLVDIAPLAIHPLLKRTAQQLLDDLSASEQDPNTCLH